MEYSPRCTETISLITVEVSSQVTSRRYQLSKRWCTTATEALVKHNVGGAAWDSKERRTRPRCHSGTRVAAIDGILACLSRDSLQAICWLEGVAGSGKTALAQTIAELLADQGRLVASFFFSRKGDGRSDVDRFVATVAYQLGIHVPALQATIRETINRHPDIFAKDALVQLRDLVTTPLQSIDSTLLLDKVIVIDAFDEAQDVALARELFFLIAREMSQLPLRILFTSRPDYRTSILLNDAPIQQVKTIDLRDFDPSHDVRAVLRHRVHTKFARDSIVQGQWQMSGSSMEALFQSASSSFVLAATIVRHIRPQGLEDSFVQEFRTYFFQELSRYPFNDLSRSILLAISQLSHATDTSFSTRDLRDLLGIMPEDYIEATRGLHAILSLPIDRDRPLCPLRDVPWFRWLPDGQDTSFAISRYRVMSQCFDQMIDHLPGIVSEDSVLLGRSFPPMDLPPNCLEVSGALRFACFHFMDQGLQNLAPPPFQMRRLLSTITEWLKLIPSWAAALVIMGHFANVERDLMRLAAFLGVS